MSSKVNKKIRVVDLFSGVGGLTFGFYFKINDNQFEVNNRFEIVFANDFNKSACDAFKKNYKDIEIFNTSIENIDSNYLSMNNIDISNIDVVIGGPPCQSYSSIGKRQNDTRSKMYVEYRRILDIIKPKIFIFENVLGILSFKTDEGKKIIDEINNDYEILGYTLNIKVLNAKDYGIPQNRKRVFIVGTRNDAKLSWIFPNPTSEKSLSLRDAISDLPKLNQNEEFKIYNEVNSSNYIKLLKGSSTVLTEHISGKYGNRLSRIIENLDFGESHKDINRKVSEGKLDKELHLTSGYSNSYGRLWWDKPSSTITNNFSVPSSIRCIHPDQNRALTIREAARIQSFPDWFVFEGSKFEKSSQIGNAVPPLLSIELAREVINSLRGSKHEG